LARRSVRSVTMISGLQGVGAGRIASGKPPSEARQLLVPAIATRAAAAVVAYAPARIGLVAVHRPDISSGIPTAIRSELMAHARRLGFRVQRQKRIRLGPISRAVTAKCRTRQAPARRCIVASGGER
jgi:hypothetical protein